MHRHTKVLAGVGVFLLFSACAGSKSERYIQSEGANFNVRLERGACYGECPVYNMDITTVKEGNGAGRAVLIFEGIRFVAHEGSMVVADLLPVEIDSLKMLLTDGGFFALDSVYDNPGITDLPTTRVEVSWGEDLTQKKAVVGRYDTPREFNQLVGFLERLRLRHI